MKKEVNFSFIANCLFLLVAVSFSYFWVNNPEVSVYTLQFVGLLIIFYFANYYFNTKGGKIFNRKTLILDAVIFTMIIYLIVSSTGYFSSSLFFLFYFLAFGVALLFEPGVALVLMLIICLFLLSKVNEGSLYDNLAKIISLVLVAPLAVFFGRQFLIAQEAKKRIKILKDWGRFLEKDLEKTNRDFSKTEENTLLFLVLEAKDGLVDIIERTSKVLGTKINAVQKEELEKVRKKAIRLLDKAKYLKKEVDERTDE